jgi:predicted nucleic acid-binding protein
MKKLVVDANVLFSALIKQNATFLLLFEGQLELYAPEFIFHEFSLHKKELLAKTCQTEENFERALAILSKRFHIIPACKITPYLDEAKSISPDPNDAIYFALALHLGNNCAIWSNDKRLKSQNKIKIISTSDLVAEFYSPV